LTEQAYIGLLLPKTRPDSVCGSKY